MDHKHIILITGSFFRAHCSYKFEKTPSEEFMYLNADLHKANKMDTDEVQ